SQTPPGHKTSAPASVSRCPEHGTRQTLRGSRCLHVADTHPNHIAAARNAPAASHDAASTQLDPVEGSQTREAVTLEMGHQGNQVCRDTTRWNEQHPPLVIPELLV